MLEVRSEFEIVQEIVILTCLQDPISQPTSPVDFSAEARRERSGTCPEVNLDRLDTCPRPSAADRTPADRVTADKNSDPR